MYKCIIIHGVAKVYNSRLPAVGRRSKTMENKQLAVLQSKMAEVASNPKDFIGAIRAIKTVNEIDELFAQATATGKAAWIANSILTVKVFERFDKNNGGGKAAEKWIEQRLKYSRSNARRYQQVGKKIIELTDNLKNGESIEFPNTRDEFIDKFMKKEPKEISFYSIKDEAATIILKDGKKFGIVEAEGVYSDNTKGKTKTYFAVTNWTKGAKVIKAELEQNGVKYEVLQMETGEAVFKINIAELM